MSIVENIGTCPLTRKQVECIDWTAKGKTASECAELMGLKKYTVQVYLRDARYATGAATVASLVARAMKEGWIQ